MNTQSVKLGRVVLVDDNAGLRRALEPAVTRWGWAVVGVRESADDLARVLVTARPDVVVLDIDMPGRSALHAIEDLRYRGSPTTVLVYSAMCDEQTVRQYLKAGALGYVCKDDASHELREGLLAVRAGRCYLSASVARLLPLGESPTGTTSEAPGLSESHR